MALGWLWIWLWDCFWDSFGDGFGDGFGMASGNRWGMALGIAFGMDRPGEVFGGPCEGLWRPSEGAWGFLGRS